MSGCVLPIVVFPMVLPVVVFPVVFVILRELVILRTLPTASTRLIVKTREALYTLIAWRHLLIGSQ